MDPIQIINGVAAAIAGAIWAKAVGHGMKISGPLTGALSAATAGVCLWYAAINLALGFGVADLGMERSVPLFRYAFVPLVLLPALRHCSQRRVRRELLATVEGHSEGRTT